MSQECKCIKCADSCTYKPGWFLPDEIREAAEYLSLSEKEFFDKYLGVDWYENSSDDTFVLAPAIIEMYPGEEYPANPRGQCVFFNNGLCDIHSVKPYECKESYHTDTDKLLKRKHLSVAQAWVIYQEKISILLGRDPISEYYSPIETLLWV